MKFLRVEHGYGLLCNPGPNFIPGKTKLYLVQVQPDESLAIFDQEAANIIQETINKRFADACKADFASNPGSEPKLLTRSGQTPYMYG